MTWILNGVALYLTYYTFLYARMVWNEGNKQGSIFTFILAASFMPLALYIIYFK